MDGYVTIGTKLETVDFDRQIEILTDKLESLEDEYNTISKEKPFEGQADQLRKMSTEIISTKKKLQSLRVEKEKIEKANLTRIKSSIDGIGNSITKITKKVIKWGLAVFGIRSAYLAVRKAASTLSQYNEQIGTDLEYIRFALASALQPIVETLINLAYKLLGVINAISMALFGYNLFAKATTKEFNKTAKSAEKMKKSLISGLDEITNIDNSNNDSEYKIPSFDLSKVSDFNIPDWMQWILDHGDEIIGILEGIAFALIGVKAGLSLTQAIGIGLIVTGIYFLTDSIKGILDEGPTWENVFKALGGSAALIAGTWVLTKSVTLTLLVAAVSLSLSAGVSVKKLIDELKPEIEDNGGFWGTWLSGFDVMKQKLKEGLKYISDEAQKFVGTKLPNMINKGVELVGVLLLNLGKKAGEIIGAGFKFVINNVISAIERTLNTPIRALNGLIKTINILPGIKISTLPTFTLPRLAKGGIVNNPGPGVMMGNYIAGERGAEAIVPLQNSAFVKDFAKQVAENIGGDNTDLLLELNRNILELANKPTILNINGKEFAQATYNDYQNESNRINASTSITIK